MTKKEDLHLLNHELKYKRISIMVSYSNKRLRIWCGDWGATLTAPIISNNLIFNEDILTVSYVIPADPIPLWELELLPDHFWELKKYIELIKLESIRSRSSLSPDLARFMQKGLHNMILSARSKQRLNVWLFSDWWNSGHTSDTERFYQFIGQYVSDHGYEFDASSFENEVAAIAGIAHDNEDLLNYVREYRCVMSHILNFMKATDRR